MFFTEYQLNIPQILHDKKNLGHVLVILLKKILRSES